jgi:hypothetical protein
MNDHFWPSLYPGMIVGGLVGLTFGNLVAVLVGVTGGTLGAAAMYFVTAWLGLEDSIASLAGLIGASLGGSYVLTALHAGWMRR